MMLDYIYTFTQLSANLCSCLYISTGIRKKLLAAGKKKGYRIILLWTRSIINHLFWVVLTSGEDKVTNEILMISTFPL